jgi:WD40 repeat protein
LPFLFFNFTHFHVETFSWPTINFKGTMGLENKSRKMNNDSLESSNTMPIVTKDCVIGAPVTCVSLPSPELCFYAQGPFLHRTSLNRSVSVPNDDNRVLVFPAGGNIHGISYASKYAVLFGGRQVAFLRGLQGERDKNESTPMETLIIRPLEQTKLVLSDWIWDCQCSSVDETTERLLIGLAHNSVEIWQVSTALLADEGAVQAQRLQCIRGNTRSITYCLALAPSGGRVAVGTVTNEILVWNVNDGISSMQQGNGEDTVCQESHRLRGHEGVIHAVKWNKSGQQLASTSDDRTVRLWNVNKNSEWTLQWTAWGHTARVWNVAFSDSGIVSTGEDGTARLWNAETGVALATLRGHACQCLWSVDTYHSLAVSGGDNGTVAVYNLEDHLVEDRVEPIAGDAPPSGSWKASFVLPDDRIIPEQDASTINNTTEEDGASDVPLLENGMEIEKKKMKKPKKKKISQQVIVGMKFDRSKVTKDTPAIIVATRAGSLMRLDTSSGSWTLQEPWCVPGMSDKDVVEASQGSCMALHPSGDFVSVGTTRGDIVIASVTPQDSNVISRCQRLVVPGRVHRAVQGLEWVTSQDLISFHCQSILWITFPSTQEIGNLGDDDIGKTIDTLVMNAGTKAVPICFAFNETRKLLVIGDARGNLALFDLNLRPDNGEPLSPSSVLPRAHQKEHVNGIMWSTENMIISVGNDGCVHECAVDSQGKLVSLLSAQTASFTGIDHVWKNSANFTFLAGYYGNALAVVDRSVGRELFRMDSGGRQRSHDLFVPKADSGGVMGLAISVNRKDGRSEVLVQLDKQSSVCATGSLGLHGESIFSACLFPISTDNETIALFTGSEDCSSKISLWQGGVLKSSKQLPLQESCVRTVCSSKHASSKTTLLVAGGGKLMLQLFLVHDIDQDVESESAERIAVELLGHGRSATKASIDHRVNAVAAIPLDSEDSSSRMHLVATGDSNGSCVLYLISEEKKTNFDGWLVHLCDRPILSVGLVRAGPRVVLLLGTTGGDVAVFDLPGTSRGVEAMSTAQVNPMLSYKAHAVGTNDIHAIVVEQRDGGSLSMLIASGGDDQSICCCELRASRVTGESLGDAKVARSSTTNEASYSAIKGVKWVDERYLLSAGYDQRLSVWQYDHPSLTLVDCIPGDVGDVNCFHALGQTAAVGGSGVELFSLKRR